MKFSLLPIFAFLTVAVVATNVALPPEIYWKSELPTTPMPEFITDLLHSTGKATIYAKGKPLNLNKQGRNVNNNIFYTEGKPFNLDKQSTDRANIYVKGSDRAKEGVDSETLLHDSHNAALFFLEKDLEPNQKMNLLFTKTSNQASFLPREVVKSIPFSSSKMAEILKEFDVKPGSSDAKVMEDTIELCEQSGIKGEEKYCATSLESMVDFSTSKLGTNVEAMSTEVIKETKKQEYTITQGVKKVGDENVVACHKLSYVYAVFYCHKIEKTIAYTVPLEGADGRSNVKTVSVCHRDTSKWNPKHLAFQVLKVKPGTVPVCHFLTQDSIVWVPKQN